MWRSLFTCQKSLISVLCTFFVTPLTLPRLMFPDPQIQILNLTFSDSASIRSAVTSLNCSFFSLTLFKCCKGCTQFYVVFCFCFFCSPNAIEQSQFLTIFKPDHAKETKAFCSVLLSFCPLLCVLCLWHLSCNELVISSSV